MSGIYLSEKHGVNPSLLTCMICGKDSGLALLGRCKNDEQAPRHMCDSEPCDNCKKDIDGYKEMGFVLFVIDDEYEDTYVEKPKHVTPWMYFRWLSVLKIEAVERIFNSNFDTSKGAAFISVSLAKQLGIPKPETTSKKEST